jgi:hypothetical protein
MCGNFLKEIHSPSLKKGVVAFRAHDLLDKRDYGNEEVAGDR